MNIRTHLQLAFFIGIAMALVACNPMSEHIRDTSAGLNGGFEVSKNGLPVNWLMYTSNTVPKADFNIILDKTDFKEGKQSLRFDVKACEDIGDWHSPGFTNEFFEVGKYNGQARYKLSFWIKNNGSKYIITAGGVESKGGEMHILIEGDEQLKDWKLLEYEIDVPKERWLRMQLNIIKPGTFWIDDIRIEKL